MKKILIFLLLILNLYSYEISKWDKPVYYTSPQYNDTLQIIYLGAGGYILRVAENAVLTAPFFSNFSLGELALTLSPKTNVIDRIYPNIPDDIVKAILVGHSHYDHLIDVPYIWNNYHKNTPVYGSLTTKCLLTSVKEDKVPEEFIHTIDNELDIYQYQIGRFIDIVPDHISMLPIESSHSSHLFGYKLFNGKLSEPRVTPPKFARDWVEGDTYAFLIKFKNGDKSFNVYFQDAASSSPKGLFNGYEDTPIDLAVLCVGGFSEAENYPEYILEKLKPKKVILGHWEDFLAPQFSLMDGINNPKRLSKDAILEFTDRIDKFNKEHGTSIEYIVPMLWKNYNFSLHE